jgi:hypothetical protein
MFNENPTSDDQAVSGALIALYDDLRELTDFCFFLCDALDGMLSPELALEPETVNGVRLSTDWVRRRSRRVADRLREICSEVGHGG